MPPPKKRFRVVPLTIQFDPPLLAWLRLEAKRRDDSIAAVVREAVRELMDKPAK